MGRNIKRYLDQNCSDLHTCVHTHIPNAEVHDRTQEMQVIEETFKGFLQSVIISKREERNNEDRRNAAWSVLEFPSTFHTNSLDDKNPALKGVGQCGANGPPHAHLAQHHEALG